MEGARPHRAAPARHRIGRFHGRCLRRRRRPCRTGHADGRRLHCPGDRDRPAQRDTVITAATFNAATPTVAEHCQINGAINQRTGVDGQKYAINFRLRLPTVWNGRLYMGGGGGTDGSVVDPVNTTVQGATLISQGYATLGTDSGHDNTIDNNPSAGGSASFGVDPQARIDFGFNAYDQTVQAGKALIARYFGKAPDKSYFVGCSEGGREAMVMSQRFPTYFDGIVAGDPGFHLPLAAMAGAQVSQAFAAVARAQGLVDTAGNPAINKTYSDPDLMLVRGAVLAACDALDGLADGIVDNIPACTPALVNAQLAALQCTGAKTASCLAANQISALQTAMAGPKNSQGQSLYNSLAVGRRHQRPVRHHLQPGLALVVARLVRLGHQQLDQAGAGRRRPAARLHRPAGDRAERRPGRLHAQLQPRQRRAEDLSALGHLQPVAGPVHVRRLDQPVGVPAAAAAR